MAASSQPERESAWEEKRRRILDGAAAVFSSRGYGKGTTKEIAAQLGLSQPSIYHYVGSKADLLREIALQVDRDMTTALRDGLAAGTDPVAQLRAIITRFTAAVIANHLTFAVYRSEQRWLEPAVAEEVQRDEREFVAAVRRVVEKVQALGKLPDAPSSVLTFAILNMVSESHRWYHQEGSLDPASVAETYCELIGLPPQD
ncbi:TetR/AcrR family transcriptional regulator [Actinomadura rupiterrae]|uniref:TetR/AcrR family transcriptional regulator n=1 Tax=Actinomadura rupiterrae TaxID=559627 RepID=UPI0020A4BBF9|nr:TetR/AcrR family transcriptional regulator [Actinomadura rupiterrae]MCP2338689.1 AcrR family transcriptional regulator [Actinomadura rupiterrae]